MALKIIFAGTVAKHFEAPDDNEDALCISPEISRIALSDGASESFDAKNWAQLLVSHVISEPLTDDLIVTCAHAYEELHDPSTLTWSKAAAYERGSFATLLVVQDNPHLNAVDVVAIGDSLAVWSDGDEILETIPYLQADQFNEKPTLLTTRLSMNPSLEYEETGPYRRTTWNYKNEKSHYLLCMTDALGAWLLRREEAGDSSAFLGLRDMRELGAFQHLVETERSAGNMRRDDTTLVVALLT